MPGRPGTAYETSAPDTRMSVAELPIGQVARRAGSVSRRCATTSGAVCCRRPDAALPSPCTETRVEACRTPCI